MNEEHLFRTTADRYSGRPVPLRPLSPPEIAGHRRAARPPSGGDFHSGDAPARRPGDAHRHHRLSGRSDADVVVLGSAAPVGALGRHRHHPCGDRSPHVDVSSPRHQHYRHRCHATDAHARHARTLSMGPASVLRRRRPVDARHLVCRRELALSDRRCRVVRPLRHPRRGSRRPICWRGSVPAIARTWTARVGFFRSSERTETNGQ